MIPPLLLRGATAIPALLLLAAAPTPPSAPLLRTPQQPVAGLLANWSVATPSRSDSKTSFRLIAGAGARNRQPVRWQIALSLAAEARAVEAVAVLETMRADEPGLAQVPTFKSMLGRTLVAADRYDDGIAMLSDPEFAAVPDLCLVRLQAQVLRGQPAAGAREWPCAAPALARLPQHRAAVGRRLVARALYGANRRTEAAAIVKPLAESDPANFLLRAEAARDRSPGLAIRLEREAMKRGAAPVRMAAALSLIQSDLAAGRIDRTEALRRLDRTHFIWRGGALEQRALMMSLSVAQAAGDLRSELMAGASLVRHFQLGADGPRVLDQVQRRLSGMLADNSSVPLPEAAGLLWDFRDMLPPGAAADATVRRLADRLATAGLTSRAADLLEYQVRQRLVGVSRAVVATQAARWRLDAGDPDSALNLLRDSETPGIDALTSNVRRRIGAVALITLGRGAEAFALLDGETGTLGLPLAAELYWQAQDWPRFTAAIRPQLPSTNTQLSARDRNNIVHAAIAAVLGNDTELTGELYRRYAVSMASGPLSGAFKLVTGDPTRIDLVRIRAALAEAAQTVPPQEIAQWFRALDAAPKSRESLPKSGR